MAVITSNNYWSEIFEELQSEIERNGHVKYLMIAKRYDEAVKLIEDRIFGWYGKHALKNKITLRQAYKKLPKDQLNTFHDLIATYLRDWREELGYDIGEKPIEHVEKVSQEDTTSETDVLNDTETWLNVLQEYQTKEDVTFYEALSIPILNEVEKLSHETSNMLLELLVITGWTVHSSITKNLNVTGLTQEQLKKELLKAWASDDLDLYSRVNANKAKLSSTVKSALVKGFRNEMSVDEVVAEVSKTMGIGEFAVKRLVTTENTHFNCYSTILAMKEAGYDAYEIVARIDGKTCEDCIDWNGDVYPISEYQPNVTAPPAHSHCRCYVTPANLKEIK